MTKLPVVYFILLSLFLCVQVECKREKTSDLVRSFGYKAVDHELVSQGYILNLVQATNPTIGGDQDIDKVPVLFIPAFFTNANSYLVRTPEGAARDLSEVDASQLSDAELEDLLTDNHSIDSISALLLNFGHEVWLLNRRGSYDSLKHVDKEYRPFLDPGLQGLSKDDDRIYPYANAIPNPKYWNFSFDEQALYDVPLAVDYVIEHSGHDKIALLGLSAGGALALMTLSSYPEMSEKISHAVLWAPAFSMVDSILTAPAVASRTLEKALIKTPSFLLPEVVVNVISKTMKNACRSPITCVLFQGLFEGRPGLKQAPLEPKLIEQVIEPTSTHEYVSLVQASIKKFMHRFDYKNAAKNELAYGVKEPPAYDLGKLSNLTKLVIFNGAYDSIVPPRAVKIIQDLIKIPARHIYLDQKEILFNHLAFATNKGVGKYVNLPTLKILES